MRHTEACSFILDAHTHDCLIVGAVTKRQKINQSMEIRVKIIMQQSGASRRLSSSWAQPAGRLRGVLVKRGTDEASVRHGAVRCVLGLHPSRQIPSALAGRGRRPWARVDPRRNPLPLLWSPTPSATLTVFGERNVRAGWLRWHTSHTEWTIPNPRGIQGQTPRRSAVSLWSAVTVVIMLITSNIHTAKQKQLMGGCVTLRCIAIGWRRHVGPSTPAFSIGRAVQSLWFIRHGGCQSNASRPFRGKHGRLANYTFSLVTRNCFDDFIGWKTYQGFSLPVRAATISTSRPQHWAVLMLCHHFF